MPHKQSQMNELVALNAEEDDELCAVLVLNPLALNTVTKHVKRTMKRYKTKRVFGVTNEQGQIRELKTSRHFPTNLAIWTQTI